MADSTERLLLQVDAATELLRRHLAEGEAPMDRFERRAVKMAETVDRSIGSMGSKFGAFAGLADDAAKRAERSFEASFSQVQRIAAQAIKGPTIDGRINLGADDIRAGAAAAQEQARSFELIGEAAQRAAVRVGDTSEATHLFIQATAASRNEAQQKANALLAEAGALERVEIELRQSAEATDLFVTKHQRLAGATAEQGRLATSAAQAALAEQSLAAAADVVRAELDPMFLAQKRFNDELDRAEMLLAAGIFKQHEYDAAVTQSRSTLYAHAQAVAGSSSASRALVNSQGAVRSAMQGVSYQVQDTFTQLSMGANVFQVVAIQGGQLAGQFSNLEGKAGNFARFMIGPWGLAFTAALLVLGPLTKGIGEMGDATDKAVDKLKKDAIETDITAKAKDRFAHSVQGLTLALRDQDKALKDSAESERSAAERSNIAAQRKRNEALEIRRTTAAKLAEAEADLDNFSLTGGATGTAGLQNQARSDRVTALRAQSAAARAAVTEAERQLNGTRVDLAAERAAISIDPVRAVTKLYDDRITALKNQQREEARLGRQVGAASEDRLRQLEAEKRAKVKLAQESQSSANRKGNNNQLGREITVADARSIVASIGGRVTSGLRSTADQERIYADKLAGRHKGPVAKPGTSDHERGKAVDVAYGPGISIASIREAFAKQGVSLRQILDEPAQRVFHVGFGKKGPSREQVADRAETARQKLISDDISYTDQERAARQRLIAATRKSADSEEEKENATAEGAEVERTATRTKIADQLSAKKITGAQADQLNELNEATYTQRLQNILVDRATRTIDRQYETAQGDLQSRVAILRINQDMATTAAERRRIGQQILEAEQELRRQALERTRDTSQDPKAVQSAKDELGRLPKVEEAEKRQFDQQPIGQLDEYRKRLRGTTDDMNDALQGVAVQGFGALENAGSQAIGSAVTNLFKLRGVAGEVVGGVISDLARLAIQKAIVSAIGGGFFGLAGGGEIGGLPGFAEGGSPGGLISGPGTGTSDSILAILGGGKGAIRVSTKEFIVNAAATQKNLPLLKAINSGRVTGYAQGGYLSSPSIPNLTAPSLPRVTGMGNRRDRLQLEGNIRVSPTKEFDARMEDLSMRTVGAAAEPIMAGATSRTMRRLSRPDLPGGIG
jgi:LAS superfamily LD-carboxypeptidase LdcB